MADAKAHLDEKAAAAAALRTDLDVRTAGLSDRREFLRRRLGEVEARLAGSMAARPEAEVRRVELDGKPLALDRPAAFVRERLPGVGPAPTGPRASAPRTPVLGEGEHRVLSLGAP